MIVLTFDMRFFQKLPILVLIVVSLLCSCQKEPKSTQGTTNLQLKFEARVDANPFSFGTTYTNGLGESYTVKTFKFYIHDIVLKTASGVEFPIGSTVHYFVNFADTASLRIPLSVTAKEYTSISFKIGVDSTRNFSGAQTGALDPTNGMFWTWNTGYIMAKLEGNSPVSTASNNAFEYHIGGYKAGENVIRSTTLGFPSGAALSVTEKGNSVITISANINKWFDGAHPLKIASNPLCTTPGALAMLYADNYQQLFTVSSAQ